VVGCARRSAGRRARRHLLRPRRGPRAAVRRGGRLLQRLPAAGQRLRPVLPRRLVTSGRGGQRRARHRRRRRRHRGPVRRTGDGRQPDRRGRWLPADE
jgi:hypothetical protein